VTAWPKQSNALESASPRYAVVRVLPITGIVEHPRTEIRDWSVEPIVRPTRGDRFRGAFNSSSRWTHSVCKRRRRERAACHRRNGLWSHWDSCDCSACRSYPVLRAPRVVLALALMEAIAASTAVPERGLRMRQPNRHSGCPYLLGRGSRRRGSGDVANERSD
jgi:hypothetical protein